MQHIHHVLLQVIQSYMYILCCLFGIINMALFAGARIIIIIN